MGEEGRRRRLRAMKAAWHRFSRSQSGVGEDSEVRDRTDIFLQRGAAATQGTLTEVSYIFFLFRLTTSCVTSSKSWEEKSVCNAGPQGPRHKEPHIE